MGTYEVEFTDGTKKEFEHIERVEFGNDRFYFIFRDNKYTTFDRILVKSFGLISFDEE